MDYYVKVRFSTEMELYVEAEGEEQAKLQAGLHLEQHPPASIKSQIEWLAVTEVKDAKEI